MEPYERVLPVHYQGDAASADYYPVDRFTRNMIEKYAIESVGGKKFKNPKKTG